MLEIDAGRSSEILDVSSGFRAEEIISARVTDVFKFFANANEQSFVSPYSAGRANRTWGNSRSAERQALSVIEEGTDSQGSVIASICTAALTGGDYPAPRIERFRGGQPGSRLARSVRALKISGSLLRVEGFLYQVHEDSNVAYGPTSSPICTLSSERQDGRLLLSVVFSPR